MSTLQLRIRGLGGGEIDLSPLPLAQLSRRVHDQCPAHRCPRDTRTVNAMGGGVAQPQYLLYHKCNAVECVKATEQLTDLWTLSYREDRETHMKRSSLQPSPCTINFERERKNYLTPPPPLKLMSTLSQTEKTHHSVSGAPLLLPTTASTKSTHHIIRTRDLKNFARSLKICRSS